MLGWLRRRREVRIAVHEEACRMLDLFGFGEAFDLLVRARVKTLRREDRAGDAYFTRLRWAIVREEERRRKLMHRPPPRADWTASTPQLAPERRAALVQRLSIV